MPDDDTFIRGFKQGFDGGLSEGARKERQRIIQKITANGYDWSHDNTYSPLQHLLNMLYREQDAEKKNA